MATREELILQLEDYCRKMAAAMARRWSGTLEYEDLLQEARMGAIEAVDTFDPSAGRIEAYASWRIRGHMIDSIRAQFGRHQTTRDGKAQFLLAARLDEMVDEDLPKWSVGVEDANLARVEDDSHLAWLRDQLWIFMIELGASERDTWAICSHLCDGRTWDDIGQQLGITGSAVCQLWRRYRASIRVKVRQALDAELTPTRVAAAS